MSSSDAVADRCWVRRWDCVHRIKLSLIYHLKRERFFDSMDRFITAVTTIAATAAVAILVRTVGDIGTTFEVWLTAVAAVMSAVATAYSPGSKARGHGQIASNMRRLWAECEAAGENWSQEQCDAFSARVLLAEDGETAQLGALVVQCENEIARSVDNLEGVRELGWWRSLWKHWWNFDTCDLRPLSTPRVAELRQRQRAALAESAVPSQATTEQHV